MNVKNKAEELVSKYYTWGQPFHDYIGKETAIECAKIAVDEIISTLSLELIRVSNRLQTKDYWQEVKNELNNM